MRYRKIILYFLAVFLSSCVNDGMDPAISEARKVTLTINIDNGANTKSDNKANESIINSLQVFVFRSNGVLDAYAFGTNPSLQISCTTGPMDIYAVINAPSLSSVKTKYELISKFTYLTDNSLTNLVMVGNVSSTISEASAITIPVIRIVARLAILKITNRLEAPPYQSKAFIVTKIYVINVAGDNNYGIVGDDPSSDRTWYNKTRYIYSSADPLVYDVVNEGAIAYGGSYETPHYFYVYPNTHAIDSQSATWSSRYTRLVVEASLDGTTYYYPVSIPIIQSNKTYTISELTITVPGSLSPDIPVSKQFVTGTITIADMTTGASQTIII